MRLRLYFVKGSLNYSMKFQQTCDNVLRENQLILEHLLQINMAN
jgi:hypothetical protein